MTHYIIISISSIITAYVEIGTLIAIQRERLKLKEFVMAKNDFSTEFLLDALFGDVTMSSGHNADVLENDSSYTIIQDMPGVKKEDVDIKLESGVLHVVGERTRDDKDLLIKGSRKMKFTSNFRLPRDVDTSSISANLEDGVLSIVILKDEEKAPKKIEIK